jgi:NitT/TauT family transport system substrate-binding protein
MLTCVHRLALASVFAITTLAVAAPADAQTKIRGGVAVNFEGMLPVWTAEEEGYFKAANIELEMLDFKGGGPTVQAFVGGSIDVCFCAGDHVVRLRSKHIPAVFLYGFDDKHDYTLVGKKGLPTSLAALKGKTLGVTSPGSMTDNTLRWEINSLKLNPEGDYQLVSSGTGAAMLAAIESGKVDAGMVVVTDREFLLRKRGGDFAILKDYTALPYASFSALSTETWIKANPEAARAFVAALDKASMDLKKDPELGKRIIKKNFPNYTDDLVEIAAKSGTSRIPDKGRYSAEAVKNLNDIMIAADPSLKPIDVNESQPKF